MITMKSEIISEWIKNKSRFEAISAQQPSVETYVDKEFIILVILILKR